MTIISEYISSQCIAPYIISDLWKQKKFFLTMEIIFLRLIYI